MSLLYKIGSVFAPLKNIGVKNVSFFQTQRPLLTCHIRLDASCPGEDITFSFLKYSFPTPWYERPNLSDIWPYGGVFETSSGQHGEFFSPDQMVLSLLHLGHDDVKAIQTMKKITQQTMYILSLKELY